MNLYYTLIALIRSTSEVSNDTVKKVSCPLSIMPSETPMGIRVNNKYEFHGSVRKQENSVFLF